MKNYSLKILLRDVVGNVLSWPAIVWIVFGYFIVFFAYLIVPTFLNDYHELRLFHDFPVLEPLGADLYEYLNFTKSFVDTGTPYIRPNYYPPFQAIFFLRFYYSGPSQSYIFITIISFLSYLAVSVVIPLMSSKHHRLNSTAILGIITGLFSYGLWFEIERGQFDLITMVICFLAIYIYHHHPRFRLAAYFLFILSVNLKIYPGIFIICFTTDWQDWKNNLRRWALLLIGSFSGLFILGWKIFLEFVNALIIQMSHPTYVWIGNHSIDSFVRLMVNKLSELNPVLLDSLNANIRWFDIAFLLIYVLCLVGIIRMTYRHKMNASNPYMLLIITLGTMLIPSTSHDYKLCILIPPMVMLFNNLELYRSGKNILDLSAIALVSLISLSYSATLFLHTDLPFLLASNFPYLLILCVSIVLLLWVRTAQSRRIENQVVFQDIS